MSQQYTILQCTPLRLGTSAPLIQIFISFKFWLQSFGHSHGTLATRYISTCNTTILISRCFQFHYTFINNQLCKDPPNFPSSWSAVLFTIVLPPQMCQLVKWVIFYQWTVAYMALAPCQFSGGGWESAGSNSTGA